MSKLLPIYEEWIDCKRCDLHKTRPKRTGVVVGNGHESTGLLLVLDGPTTVEHEYGGYLLGGSDAQLIAHLLADAEIDSGSIYITGAVGCAPITVVPATDEAPARREARVPSVEESRHCYPRLHSLIYEIDPRIIVTMGEGAWKSLVPAKTREAERRTKHASATDYLFTIEVQGRRGTPLLYSVLAAPSLRTIAANPNSNVLGPYNSAVKALRHAMDLIKWTKEEQK